MEGESCVPPGFRFHPTEEELVGYYLRRKIAFQRFDIEVISDIDLYKIEPWDLQDKCRLGYEEQKEWYFFSHKDKKYPSGTRTNRATAAGFWKATGRDKAILLSKSKLMIGMRKTLVFYEGRAPNGRKSDWIMHEYRLQSTEEGPPQACSYQPNLSHHFLSRAFFSPNMGAYAKKCISTWKTKEHLWPGLFDAIVEVEEGWVVCRAFKKQSPNPARTQCFSNYMNPSYFIRDKTQYHEIFQTETTSARSIAAAGAAGNFNIHDHPPHIGFGIRSESKENQNLFENIPHLVDSPAFSSSSNFMARDYSFETAGGGGGVVVDWKNLDSLLASSQLADSTSCSNLNALIMNGVDYGVDDDQSPPGWRE
ncbi:NAC domain-containing protein 7 [Platanthera zijinensis]|uniref:NAC domain-containing protein 7 n=1 Tax=Platanthera zijinensis TaxID=2320716 RepID=A0AAP0GDH4_9ASPA